MQYLGSTVIKELRGTESTKKSIQKLKKNEKILGLNAINSSGGITAATAGLTNHTSHNTKRAVNILISYRGVQFVDPELQVNIAAIVAIETDLAVVNVNPSSSFRIQYVNTKSET